MFKSRVQALRNQEHLFPNDETMPCQGVMEGPPLKRQKSTKVSLEVEGTEIKLGLEEKKINQVDKLGLDKVPETDSNYSQISGLPGAASLTTENGETSIVSFVQLTLFFIS